MEAEAMTRPWGRAGAMTPHELGRAGEDVACTYLERHGYEILERNWTCPGGEADVIARDGTEHVLVEVKSRLVAEGDETFPELAVDRAKRRRYRDIAACYLEACGIDAVRFDVIAVSFVDTGIVHVRHLVDAFGGDE